MEYDTLYSFAQTVQHLLKKINNYDYDDDNNQLITKIMSKETRRIVLYIVRTQKG